MKDVDMSNLLKSIETDLDELQALTKSFMDSGAAPQEPEEGESFEHEAAETPVEEAAEEEMPEEGMPGEEGSDVEDLAAYAASLPDELLEQVIEIMISEMEARSGGEEGMGEMDKAMPAEAPVEEGAVMPPEAGLEAGLEGEQPAEGPMSVEAVEQDLAALPPEELAVLVEALSNVLTKEEAPAAEPAAAPAAAPMAPAAKSVPTSVKGSKAVKDPKQEPESSNLTKLSKSLDEMNDRLAKIEKATKAAKAPAASTPATRYADAKVKVLEKSVNEGAKMNHMELANWLLAQQRAGNKLVKSIHVAKANTASTPEALGQLYAELNGYGVVPPSKA